jgi:hypothetical protein
LVRAQGNRVFTALVLAIGLALLPSCGSSSKGEQRARHPTPAPKAPTGPRVGKRQHIKTRKTKLEVTVRRVIDPLKGSGATVDPGSRAVGVRVSVRNRGSGPYDGSSKSDFKLVSHGNVPAAQVFAPSGKCSTPEVDFLRQFGSGQSGSGCVVFALEEGEHPGRVTFSPHDGSGRHLTWIVGK